MKLSCTVDMMQSEDWKDRLIAEYLQTKCRYERLRELTLIRELGRLEFDTRIPIEYWKNQLYHMGEYLNELEKQALIHEIVLPTWQRLSNDPKYMGAVIGYGKNE